MATRVRLLFFTAESCPTFRADVNVLFGRYLPRLGVASDVVAARTPGAAEPIRWGGGEALLCSADGGQASKYAKVLFHGIRHLLAADRDRYDAIQVRDMPVLATFALLVARIKRLPFVYWMSYPIPEGQIELARERGLSAGWMKFLFPWLSGRLGRLLLYRIVLPGATHVFVQSDMMKHELMARGLRLPELTPVPMGVDLEAIALSQRELQVDPRLSGRRVIAYLGTLDRPRRIEVLFAMLALLKRDMPDIRLVLAGDTQDEVHRKWLKRQAALAGVEGDVVWTGWCSTDAAWRKISTAEVGLSPFPRGELLDSASPTKVPEYLALGVPVVCNDNPDQAAVIATSGAGRCVPYTAEAFAAAVSELMSLDVQARAEMIAGGRRYVAAHRDYRLVAERVAEAYRKILGGSPVTESI
jgi:glycosyltransferase involved in cell wall biosynthesis